MIYGPKEDGTYVVEFKTAAGEAMAISIPWDRGGRDPALSRADALWTVRAGGGSSRSHRLHSLQR
jgi:hypothetical protein